MEGTSLNQAMFLLRASCPSVTQGKDVTVVFHKVTQIQFDVWHRRDFLIYSDRTAEQEALVLFLHL